MTVTTAPLSRRQIIASLADIAELRITVFRDWPYLYDGDAEYEARYLAPYAQSSGALVVGAWDQNRLVGAATATPMEDHAEEFGAPLVAAGYALNNIYYFGESVLMPEYRGRGIGHAFFDHREAQANNLGRRYACFCAVIRSEDDPRRPAAYQPLDGFWRKRGYAPLDGVSVKFSWKDVGDTEETDKEMRVWLRDLSA